MRRALVFCILTAVICTGCMAGGFNSAQKTGELQPGMNFVQVFEILGKPVQSEFRGMEWIVKYNLHEAWKGNVPYYVVFNAINKEVIYWYADEAEYQRNQMMYMQMAQDMGLLEQPGTQGGSGGSGGGTGDGGYVGAVPTADTSASTDTFVDDSAGYPGGAYENPASSYYEPAVYE